MKTLRFVGVLIVLALALFGGVVTARADGPMDAPADAELLEIVPADDVEATEAAPAFVYRPDLVVFGPLYVYRDIYGHKYIRFTVKNVGTAPAGFFRVRLFTPAGLLRQDIAVFGLGVGQTRTYVHNAGACFQASRKIVVDATNLVAELNEFNNVRFVAIGCP
jgi:hypothetical protein